MGIPTTHNTMGDCMSTSESIAAAPSPPLSRPIAADSDRMPLLEDNTVTLAPYFTVHDVDKFKAIWRADYAQFAHKEDCVHYAFTFSDDNHAHCREAYQRRGGAPTPHRRGRPPQSRARPHRGQARQAGSAWARRRTRPTPRGARPSGGGILHV